MNTKCTGAKEEQFFGIHLAWRRTDGGFPYRLDAVEFPYRLDSKRPKPKPNP
jgi:hypothetical protein